MPVQFNAKTYVVEPIYRDDGLGLWDFGDQAPSSGEALDLAVEAARIEQRDDRIKVAPPRRSRGSEQVGRRGRRARPARHRDREISRMDRAHGIEERPEWTTVRKGQAIRQNPL